MGAPDHDEIVEIVPHDPRWAAQYAAESAALGALLGEVLDAIEHFGSTAIAGLPAKPVIDIMAAVPTLAQGEALVPALAMRGYMLIETGMPGRLFLRRPPRADCAQVHLHIVTSESWPTRAERLFRDHLRAHPGLVRDYGLLKQALARRFRDDPLAYTRHKTDFIQSAVDVACDDLGQPRVRVWEE